VFGGRWLKKTVNFYEEKVHLQEKYWLRL